MSGEDFYTKKYKKRLLDYEEWVLKADQLLDAAGLFEGKIHETWDNCRNGTSKYDDRFISIYFMLSSYAIENLLKAVIIKKQRKELENTINTRTKFPAMLKEHDLFKLAKRGNLLNFALGNEEYLKKLTRSAIWYGRYPMPTNPSDFNPFSVTQQNQKSYSLSSYTSMDVKEVKRLVNEIRGFLK
jgi:hypothetical protein